MQELATAAAVATGASVTPSHAAASRRVTFECEGRRLVGDLFLHDGYKDRTFSPNLSFSIGAST